MSLCSTKKKCWPLDFNDSTRVHQNLPEDIKTTPHDWCCYEHDIQLCERKNEHQFSESYLGCCSPMYSAFGLFYLY